LPICKCGPANTPYTTYRGVGTPGLPRIYAYESMYLFLKCPVLSKNKIPNNPKEANPLSDALSRNVQGGIF